MLTRVFSPERLPHTLPLLPSINSRGPESGAAYNNAKLAQHKHHAQIILNKISNSIMESLPGREGGGGGIMAAMLLVV